MFFSNVGNKPKIAKIWNAVRPDFAAIWPTVAFFRLPFENLQFSLLIGITSVYLLNNLSKLFLRFSKDAKSMILSRFEEKIINSILKKFSSERYISS